MMTQSQHASVNHGHAVHFLERLNHRASDSSAALAMDLYHQPQMVRYLVSAAPIPKTAKRVAVSLDDSNRGPYAVVDSSTGRFITCLSEGMRSDLYCIKHGQLLAYQEKHRQHQIDMERAAPTLSDEKARKQLFRRLRVAGGDVSSEEIQTLIALQGALRPWFLRTLLEEISIVYLRNKRLLAHRRLHPSRHRAVLKGHYDAQWLTGHLSLLVSLDGTRGLAPLFDSEAKQRFLRYIALGCTNGMMGQLLRVVYAIGRFGKALLPECKRAALNPDSAAHWLLGTLGLGIIALRQSKCRAEVRKTFKQIAKSASRLPLLICKLWHDAGPEALFGSLIAAVEEPDKVDGHFLEFTRSLYTSNQNKLPETYRFETEAAVPESLARQLFSTMRFSIFEEPRLLTLMFQALPWLSRCEPHELYSSKKVVEETFAPWRPDQTIQLVAAERNSWGIPSTPVTAEKRPGRNDPCFCGSKKKYKKCCLGVSPPKRGQTS